MKTPDNRSGVARREGNGKTRRARGDMDARTEARIRTVAAIVRHRQETLYDRLADRFRIAFAAGADKKRESMAMAAEKAREQLTAAGALTQQQGERLKSFLLRDLGSPDDAIAYRTGEVTCAGTLTCIHCQATLRFKQTGTVPPCPTCAKTEFRKHP